MSFEEVCQQLRQRKARFFALVTPLGCRASRVDVALAESLMASSEHACDLVVQARAEEHGLMIQRAVRRGEHVDVPRLWGGEEAARVVLSNELPAVVVLSGLECLPLAKQMRWLGVLRSIREKARSPAVLQLVVVGAWSSAAFLSAWRTERQHVSPPFDRNNVYWVGSLSHSDVESRLREAVVAESPYLRALAELAHEHTGGDAALIDILFDWPRRRSHEEFEEAVFALPTFAATIDEVRERIGGLGAMSLRKLAACLRFGGVLHLPEHDLDCEQLALAGLLRLGKESPRLWRVASPSVARVLRSHPQELGLPAEVMLPDRELLPTRHPIAAQVNARVCEIENLLRNLVVTELFQLASGGHPLQAIPRRGDEDIYAAAIAKRDQDDNAPHIYLVSNPLSCQLDVAHLSSIILHERLYERRFARYFPDRTSFKAKFDEFNGLRRLAAHNKIASVRCLAQLSGLLSFFEQNLARVAREEALRAVPAELVRVVEGSVRVIKALEKKEIVVTFEVENLASASLYGVSVVVTVTTSNGQAPLEAAVRDQTFKVGERRALRTTARAVSLHFDSELSVGVSVVTAQRDSSAD